MLDISLVILIFVMVLFLTLVYVLNDMLYKPLLAFIDKRDKSIRDDLASSQQNKDEIEAALAEANEKISVAKGKASDIRGKAVIKAKELASQTLEESKNTIEGQYTSFIEQLAKDKDVLKKSISSNLSSYQDGIATKIKNI